MVVDVVQREYTFALNRGLLDDIKLCSQLNTSSVMITVNLISSPTHIKRATAYLEEEQFVEQLLNFNILLLNQ